MLLSETKLFQGFQISIPNTLVYALIGIVGVFAVLAVLIGLLYLFQLIFKFNVLDKIGGLFKKKNKDTQKSESTASVSTAQPEEDEDEIVAVICAAISAVYEAEGGEVPPFVIRSVKRK